MMKYKAAVFDMDGTILDTLQDLADAMNYELKKNNMPERNIDEIRRFVGNGIRKLVERACPDTTAQDKIDAIFADFIEYYKTHCEINTKPYAGIQELLQKVRSAGVKIAVNSNKADSAVQILCGKYFPKMFDTAVGEREGFERKPAPDSVNEILRRFGIKKEEAVYIGDSDVDFETAKNAELDFIGVDWGFRGRDFLQKCGAKTIAMDTAEAARLILES